MSGSLIRSREIAKKFEKDHTEIIKDIENFKKIIIQYGDNPSNFFISLCNLQGHNLGYLCTKEGVVLLIMRLNYPNVFVGRHKDIIAYERIYFTVKAFMVN